uniref:Ig-like domain-containing protein n=1 Tax=Fundulus heteroclitus TaxID=8078 RepID=A0A3Q2P1X6_FUNHE
MLWCSGLQTDGNFFFHQVSEPGQNVILPCRAPDSKPVVAVEWTRTDLGSEYVLLYRNNQFDLENQHPSFKNRVDLQEGQIKTGDVSLVLKNVSTDDRGTYECLLIQTDINILFSGARTFVFRGVVDDTFSADRLAGRRGGGTTRFPRPSRQDSAAGNPALEPQTHKK